jgi:hypothetical protein
MKKILILLIISALAGCASHQGVPVTVKFPDVPQDMLIACPNLNQLDSDQVKELSQVLEVVTTNYSQYYNCKAMVDNWIEWYKAQKSIFDKVGK